MSIMDGDFTRDAWGLSGLLFGLDHMSDTEGRPLAERRAPSAVKKSVPMELRSCPYHDEREGRPMNISALGQLTQHLPAVLADIEAFHRHPNSKPGTWTGMFVAVTDQLVGPALHVLASGRADGLVPARVSVGYKLAAGFFDVMRRLLREDAIGRAPPVGVDAFAAFVKREGALIGQSEVCAGPPHLIARSTEAFLRGSPAEGAVVDELRWQVVDLLCAQIRVGIAWSLFDRWVERRVFFDADASAFAPRNRFMQQRFDARRAESREFVLPNGVAGIAGALPGRVGGETRRRLSARLDATTREPVDQTAMSRTIEELSMFGDGALLVGPERARRVARSMGAYIDGLQGFTEVVSSLEREIRVRLDYPLEAPISLDGLVLPKPRALAWFEAVVGHRLSGTAEGEALRLANHHRSIPLPPAAD